MNKINEFNDPEFTNTEYTNQKDLPFGNLFLINGLVTGRNKLWMYLFTLFLLLFGYLIYQAIILFPLSDLLNSNGFTAEEIKKNPNLLFDNNALKLDKNWVLLLELGMFVSAFLFFIIGLKYIHLKTITSVLTGYQKFRFKRFYFAFLIWGCGLILFVLGDFILNTDNFSINFNVNGFILSAIIMCFFMPIQTGIEEIIFRGYLIQGLSQVLKNGIIPIMITSFVFSLAHMSNPEVKEYGWQIMFFYYFLFALFLGCITLIDEGLELAFGIHFANNLISSLLINSKSSVIKTYSIFETKSENLTLEIWVWLLMATIIFFIFKMKYNWCNFKTLIK